MDLPVFVTKPDLPGFDEYVSELRRIWDTATLTNSGPLHEELEAALICALGVTGGLTLFANGHLALECALTALELSGEVITTPFTFASTTQAIVRAGLTPVFCDINPGDLTLDAAKIEPLITKNTSAILPVHVYGHICDAGISGIAAKHGLKVIYDAAHAFGETYNGIGVGNMGDVSMFSFHATKNFNTVEGGALVYADKRLAPKLKSIRNFGISGDDAPYVGLNAKMSEFHAAIGLCNLRRYDERRAARAALVARYRERLDGVRGLTLFPPCPNTELNYCYFPVIVNETEYGGTRDGILAALAERNIYARKYFYPLTSSFSCYKGRFEIQYTPVAEYFAARVLTLPLYAELAAGDADRVCAVIRDGVK